MKLWRQLKGFNLTEMAIRAQGVSIYFMLVCLVAGVSAYLHLGRNEDPEFTVKTMVVQTLWPGATQEETMQQVTDRIEKKLQDTPNLYYLKSYTIAGTSTVFVYLLESTPKKDVPDLWYQVRKKVGDIRQTLPQGVVGPFFNDEFGDTYRDHLWLHGGRLQSPGIARLRGRGALAALVRMFPRPNSGHPGRADLCGVLHAAAWPNSAWTAWSGPGARHRNCRGSLRRDPDKE